MNLGPSGYEPDELPGCSTPRCCVLWVPAGVDPGLDPGRGPGSAGGSAGLALGSPGLSARLASLVATVEPGLRRVSGGFGRPGGDLLFRALRRSTIGAEGFHGRVRDGIGCYAPRYGHQAVQSHRERPRACERLRERCPGLDPGPILRRPRPAEASCGGLLKARLAALAFGATGVAPVASV